MGTAGYTGQEVHEEQDKSGTGNIYHGIVLGSYCYNPIIAELPTRLDRTPNKMYVRGPQICVFCCFVCCFSHFHREFVQAVCTFCCLSVTDMLKFCFMVYDKDRSGHMEMEELHHFIKASFL